jgi:hypothetical protein
MKKKEWRKWLPNIALRIYLPFIRIETTLMYERMESMTVEWTGIDIQAWKYRVAFNWYWKPL